MSTVLSLYIICLCVIQYISKLYIMQDNVAHNCQFVTLKRRLKQYKDQTQNQKLSPCSNKLLLNILFLGNSYEQGMFLRRVGGYLLTKQHGVMSQNNVIFISTTIFHSLTIHHLSTNFLLTLWPWSWTFTV